MREAADSIGVEPPDKVRDLVNAAYDFLNTRFLPSSRAEQAARRPNPHDYVLGERDRTAEEIDRQTHRLTQLNASYDKAVTKSLGNGLRANLYGIAVLVDLHYAT